MTAGNPDRLIAAFLAEGPSLLPDQTFDAIRADIHQTRQRVVLGPWRVPVPASLARVAVAAAAVVAIGIAWVNGGPGIFGAASQPAPASTATAGPTASPSPPEMPFEGPVPPGRYRIRAEVPGTVPWSPGVPVSVTVPAGYEALEGALLSKSSPTAAGPAFGVWAMTNTFVDPCTDHRPRSPVAGIDALIAALSDQPGVSARPPRDVEVDGYRGTSVELTVERDITECGGPDEFWLWGDATGDRRYVQDTGEVDRIYVLDVDGQRFSFFLRISPATTAAELAELEAIVASMDIEAEAAPPVSGATPEPVRPSGGPASPVPSESAGT